MCVCVKGLWLVLCLCERLWVSWGEAAGQNTLSVSSFIWMIKERLAHFLTVVGVRYRFRMIKQ